MGVSRIGAEIATSTLSLSPLNDEERQHSRRQTLEPQDHRREVQGFLDRTVLFAYPWRCCAGGTASWIARCDTPKGFSFRDQDQVSRMGAARESCAMFQIAVAGEGHGHLTSK